MGTTETTARTGAYSLGHTPREYERLRGDCKYNGVTS